MTALADQVLRLERRVAELESRLAAWAPDRQHTASSPTANAATAPVVATAQTAPPLAAATRLPTTVTPASAVAAANIPPAAGTTTPPPPARSRSLAELEEQLSSRLLAWVGGIALVLGAMFFLSLAFSRGWIGPEARVLIGLVAGGAALLSGAWLFERSNRTPATVLTGVGVGTGALALFAASRLYGFIPIEVTLLALLVVALGTAEIALRANSQAVAAFGLIATTLAPPVLGASPNPATVTFLGIALVGTALISFGRSWPWLAFFAFLFTAPQASRWFFSEPNTVLAVAGIGALWAINALAAAGSALARVRTTVHRASASLLALNALLAIHVARGHRFGRHGGVPADRCRPRLALVHGCADQRFVAVDREPGSGWRQPWRNCGHGICQWVRIPARLHGRRVVGPRDRRLRCRGTVRRDRPAWLSATTTAAVFISIGAWEAVTVVALPGRVLVDPHRTSGIVPLLNTGSLALVAVAVALGSGALVLIRWSPARPAGGGSDPIAAGAIASAGAVILYLVSIAIVDAFQTRVTRSTSSSEIATQAQVALSIAWVLIGASAFAIGLVRRIGVARGFGLGLLGLGLLGLATAKVFLFDLAALDVSYRVLSFLGLGGVLLASSFVAARFRAPGAASGALEETVDDVATSTGVDSRA